MANVVHPEYINTTHIREVNTQERMRFWTQPTSKWT